MSVPDLMTLARRGPVHFMGIGGAGMCALAELLLRAGGQVSGCDLRGGPAVDRLRSLGADVVTGHDPAHVAGVEAVVVTSAVPPGHPELAEARSRGVPVVKRAQALADIVNRGTLVAVAGTHGKTTTTALAAAVLAGAGLDPTGLVGGTVAAWGGNLLKGGNELYVVEADEYDRSFHTLTPDVAVVTNLEADHLDIYGDLAGVRAAFGRFLEGVRPGGCVVACADDPGAARLLPPLSGRVAVVTYGTAAGSVLRAVEVRPGPGGTRFRVEEAGEDRGELRLPLPGLHNLRNALAAAAVARHLGAEWEGIAPALSAFRGVGRRFQLLGEPGGVAVVDDYAHHPTEVAATLDAVRGGYPGRRVIAVFQPHLFSRTRDFGDELGRALARADRVWVSDVYPAREDPLPGVTGEIVADAAESAGTGAAVRYHAELEGLAAAVAREAAEGDVVVIMGAGSVEAVGPELVAHLQEEGSRVEA